MKTDKEKLLALADSLEWQDMDSAPHGIWILIRAYDITTMACWNGGGFWSTFMDGRVSKTAAEGWMPLPTGEAAAVIRELVESATEEALQKAAEGIGEK